MQHQQQSPTLQKQKSLFRVKTFHTDDDDEEDLLQIQSISSHSKQQRASTYHQVHDAALHNLRVTPAGERSEHDRTVPMGVMGLQNLGNTCFLNSSLQCLSATIPLTDYFLGYDFRSEINATNVLGTGGTLVTAYAELMKHMWFGTTSVVAPIEFKAKLGTFAPQFNGSQQHDTQELLSYLLDGIHEDLNRVTESPPQYVEEKDCDGSNDEHDAVENWKNYLLRNKSLIVDLFQGQLRNTCQCLTCGHVNIRFEPFMYLSLPITNSCHSVDDCLDLYLKQEQLVGNNQYYCSHCKAHVDGTKKQDLWMLPPVLIVHLKRFRYDDFGNVGSKNDASISYPVRSWDLKARVQSTRGVDPTYDLYAVSNHMGGLGSGHYIAHTLNRFDDNWYEHNDRSYRRVDNEAIHRSTELTQSTYVLFYNRSEGEGGGGDRQTPLHKRRPMIRRQSVSRPDLWPHSQVKDPHNVRNFARKSQRNLFPTGSIIDGSSAGSSATSTESAPAQHPQQQHAYSGRSPMLPQQQQVYGGRASASSVPQTGSSYPNYHQAQQQRPPQVAPFAQHQQQHQQQYPDGRSTFPVSPTTASRPTPNVAAAPPTTFDPLRGGGVGAGIAAAPAGVTNTTAIDPFVPLPPPPPTHQDFANAILSTYNQSPTTTTGLSTAKQPSAAAINAPPQGTYPSQRAISLGAVATTNNHAADTFDPLRGGGVGGAAAPAVVTNTTATIDPFVPIPPPPPTHQDFAKAILSTYNQSPTTTGLSTAKQPSAAAAMNAPPPGTYPSRAVSLGAVATTNHAAGTFDPLRGGGVGGAAAPAAVVTNTTAIDPFVPMPPPPPTHQDFANAILSTYNQSPTTTGLSMAKQKQPSAAAMNARNFSM